MLGIWLGMICGYTVTSAIGFFFAFGKPNWIEQTQKAVERSQIKKKESKDPESDPILPK